VRVLLDNGANVNAKEKSKSQTALMWAASERHPAVAKMLVDHGADVNARSKVTAAPARGGPGAAAAGANAAGAGAAGARGAAAGARGAAPAAPAAAGQGAPAQAAAAPPPQGPIAGTGGVTPLMLAARENSLETVKILVDGRADANVTSANGSTALLMAILNGNYQVAEFLLDHGANPNIADKDGKAALYATVEMRNLATTDTPGPSTDKAQALELTEALLKHGADANARLSGRPPFRGGANRTWLPEPGATPFYRAAVSGDVKTMRLLLGYGADPYITTQDNTTP
jgi:ankyrin repeat protein